MKFFRSSRLITACILLVSMLFMQLAVAGYACPNLNIGPAEPVSISMSMSADDDMAMSGCSGADTAQPSLCQANDQAGNQSLDKPPLPLVQPFMAVALTLVFPNVELAVSDTGAEPVSPLLLRTTAPPLSIRNCCFRI